MKALDNSLSGFAKKVFSGLSIYGLTIFMLNASVDIHSLQIFATHLNLSRFIRS